MTPVIAWMLVALVCDGAHCVPLQPAPPPLQFDSEEECDTFALRTALQGGVYKCVEDDGV